jgi:hypothetical protein
MPIEASAAPTPQPMADARPEVGPPVPRSKMVLRADGASLTRVPAEPPPRAPKIRGVYYGKPRCPYCGSLKLRVISTRPNAATPKRVYECQDCQAFRTGEATRFTIPEQLTGREA